MAFTMPIKSTHNPNPCMSISVKTCFMRRLSNKPTVEPTIIAAALINVPITSSHPFRTPTLMKKRKESGLAL